MTEKVLTSPSAEEANGQDGHRDGQDGHRNGQVVDKDKEKKMAPRKKVYILRNSMLTDLMEVTHVQTVYNISVALCILLAIMATAFYIAVPQKFFDDLEVMLWAANKWHVFTASWIAINVGCFAVHIAFCAWARNRHRLPLKLMDMAFWMFFTVVIVLMYTGTPYVVLKLELGPITAFALLSEQVRMFMKVYSFVRENYPRILKHDNAKDGNQVDNICPSFSHFLYFLFAPVLIYRDSYPRTKEIRWSFVAINFLKVGTCVFIAHCLMHRFFVDIFGRIGHETFPAHHVVLMLAGCMIVGPIMMFLIFYTILHSWFNAFAEMLRFGDRQFYKDWWNSTSFSQYYRMWNGVVYDWLYNYVYMDLHLMGLSRAASMLTVFVSSAIVHDYIICFALGFFFPALGVIYSSVGILVMFLTRSKKTQFWNIFMWAMLFGGWGALTFMYGFEWYARKNCPWTTVEGPLGRLVPQFLFCQLLEPS